MPQCKNMANASRDNNRVTTIMAVDSNGDPVNLQVDNATGRLLVAVEVVASVVPTVQPTEVRDNNRIPTLYGADASGDPASLLTDNRNDNLWITLNIE